MFPQPADGGLSRQPEGCDGVERGVERGCDAIQIFHQSPRMWRPTRYADADFAAFREAFDAHALEAVVIHAVYLINCASKEREIRAKSIASLTHALRVGDGIGAAGVVLHAGARKGEPQRRLDEARREGDRGARSPTPRPARCCSRTPPGRRDRWAATSTSSPSWSSCSTATERSASASTAVTCSPRAIEIRTAEALDEVVDEFDAKVGLERLRCLHVNDSKIPLGGNRDRHANLGDGEIGERGLAIFLSEPRFEELPTLIETGAPTAPPAGRRRARPKAARARPRRPQESRAARRSQRSVAGRG